MATEHNPTEPTPADYESLYRGNLSVATNEFAYLYGSVLVTNPDHVFTRDDYILAKQLCGTMLEARIQFDAIVERLKQA